MARLTMREATTRVLPAAEAAIAEAASVLRAGGLVAFPTETVYGLGGDATQAKAVAAIFAAKERPQFNPLIVHVASLAAAEGEAEFDDRARRLARRFWPGPLTLVLPRRADGSVDLLAAAGLPTLAIRVPNHPVAAALLAAFARPVAAPSANPSGRVSPTTADHVVDGLRGRVDLVLDGGACPVGVESTILDLTQAQPVLLRPGGVPLASLVAQIGPIRAADARDGIKAPGMLARHYAPDAPIRLAAGSVGPREALLAFGPSPLTGARRMLNLSVRGDVVEAAANLYAMLRALDGPDIAAIAVMAVPGDGLGAAINDRLRRAATRD